MSHPRPGRLLPALRPVRPPRRLGAFALGWCLSMWLGVQCMALLHGVWHAPLQSAPGLHSLTGAAQGGDPFGHAPDHEAGGPCQLFDQLAHADVVWCPPPLAGLPVGAAPRRLGEAPPRRPSPAAGAHARGPPAVA